MPIDVQSLRGNLAAWLTDTGQTTTASDEYVVDPETNEVVPGPPVVHYEGSMLIYPQPAQEQQVTAGEATFQVTRYNVLMPAGVDVGIGYGLTVTACELNPALVGKDFTVLDVPLDSLSVATTAVVALVT